MVTAMGINIRLLFRLVFSFGLLLAALAGIMLGPLVAVQAGMGDDVLILAFVVVVIGGIGSVPGAAIGALIVGVVDTLGRGCCRSSSRSSSVPMRPPRSVRRWAR
jgi:branched-chain amino acid transport system permease protein